MDEKSQIQAVDRTQPSLPIKPGRAGTMTDDDKRNGTTTLFAALDVLSGRVIGQCLPRHRHREFLTFLKTIDREVPKRLNVHLVLDNYATHNHPKVRAWLERHPRFHLHFTPTSSSWLNMVEIFFSRLTEKAIRRGIFHSVPDLINAIENYLAAHNAHPNPFTWTATTDHPREGPPRPCHPQHNLQLNMGHTTSCSCPLSGRVTATSGHTPMGTNGWSARIAETMQSRGQQHDDPEPRNPVQAGGGRLVVLVSGLPGVGKSMLADALAPRLGAAVLSRDAARISSAPGGLGGLAEAIAWRVAHRRLATAQRRAGRILESAVAQQLGAGRSVIVEAVAEPQLRQRLHDVALDYEAAFVQLECVLPDRAEHHRRFGVRREGARFWRTIVASIESGYQPPAGCLLIETSAAPDQLADQALRLIMSA